MRVNALAEQKASQQVNSLQLKVNRADGNHTVQSSNLKVQNTGEDYPDPPEMPKKLPKLVELLISSMLLVTQLLVLYGLLDLAWLRQLSHQRLLLHVVHVCLQLLRAHLLHDIGKLLLGRINGTLCLAHQHHRYQVGIALANQLLGIGIDGLQWQLRYYHLVELTLVLYRWDWLVGDEVIHIDWCMAREITCPDWLSTAMVLLP